MHCEDYDEPGEDPEGGYGGGGGGGYGEGEQDPPPPPPGQVEELLTVEDFEAFLDNDDASVIAAFQQKEIVDPNAVMPEGWDEDEDGPWEAPAIEHPTLTSFNAISGSTYGFRYAYTTASEVLAKIKCKTSGLFLYKSPKFLSKEHGDKPRERFPSEKLNEGAVSKWLKAKAQPLVGQYSSTTKDRYTGPVLVIFLSLDFGKNEKSINYVLKRARKAAVGLKGKLSIAVASVTDLSYELSDYGLKSTHPASEILMGIADGSDYYGSDSDAFSAKAMQAFADSFLKGELTPYVKPDEPPPSSDEEEPPMDDEDGEGEEGDKEEM